MKIELTNQESRKIEFGDIILTDKDVNFLVVQSATGEGDDCLLINLIGSHIYETYETLPEANKSILGGDTIRSAGRISQLIKSSDIKITTV